MKFNVKKSLAVATIIVNSSLIADPRQRASRPQNKTVSGGAKRNSGLDAPQTTQNTTICICIPYNLGSSVGLVRLGSPVYGAIPLERFKCIVLSCRGACCIDIYIHRNHDEF